MVAIVFHEVGDTDDHVPHRLGSGICCIGHDHPNACGCTYLRASDAPATYGRSVIEIGSRARNQAPPPHVVFEALAQPNRDPNRTWLELLDDEQPPTVIASERPATLTWSSLWTKRPDATIRFDLPGDGSGGTNLRWTLYVEEPSPDQALIGHMRKRMNQLINANLRYTFGQ
jgi:hypothetical protein